MILASELWFHERQEAEFLRKSRFRANQHPLKAFSTQEAVCYNHNAPCASVSLQCHEGFICSTSEGLKYRVYHVLQPDYAVKLYLYMTQQYQKMLQPIRTAFRAKGRAASWTLTKRHTHKNMNKNLNNEKDKNTNNKRKKVMQTNVAVHVNFPWDFCCYFFSDFMLEMNHMSKSGGLNQDFFYCSVWCSSGECETLWENCSLLST